MPTYAGGEFPDPINTDTEYAGNVPLANTVKRRETDMGTRTLEPHEKKRLGLLTGQDEDPDAPRQPGFMGGVDDNFPEHADLDGDPMVDPEYRSEDYQW